MIYAPSCFVDAPAPVLKSVRVETFDPEALMTRRRDALMASLRQVDAVEARRFIEEIFAGRQSHPWFKPSQDFLDDRPQATFVRGEVGDGYALLYDPAAHAGLWCKLGENLEAVGRLHGRGLEAVKEVVARFLASPQDR